MGVDGKATPPKQIELKGKGLVTMTGKSCIDVTTVNDTLHLFFANEREMDIMCHIY